MDATLDSVGSKENYLLPALDAGLNAAVCCLVNSFGGDMAMPKPIAKRLRCRLASIPIRGVWYEPVANAGFVASLGLEHDFLPNLRVPLWVLLAARSSNKLQD